MSEFQKNQDLKTFGFRYVLEAAFFFGLIAGLSDSSCIFPQTPDLVYDVYTPLRFLSAASFVSFAAFLLYLSIIFIFLYPVVRLKVLPLSSALNLLYFFGFLPMGIILCRNFAILTAANIAILTEIRAYFYFFKYIMILLPAAWGLSFWMAHLRAGIDFGSMFARLSGLFLATSVFIVLTPILQQRHLIDLVANNGQATSGKEGILIIVAVFVSAIIILLIGTVAALKMSRVLNGIILYLAWILCVAIPFVPPIFQGNPAIVTPSAGNPAAGRNSNVILVSLDTVRYDEPGFNGNEITQTLTLDTLAEKSVVFDNAVSPIPLTGPAHISVFTGLQPDTGTGHGVKSNGIPLPGEIPVLAEILNDSGYRTGAVIGSYILSRQASGLDRGFNYYNDQFSTSPVSRYIPDEIWNISLGKLIRKFTGIKTSIDESKTKRAGEVTDQAIDWLKANSENPFFLFVHYYDAHFHYNPPEPFNNLYMPYYSGRYRDVSMNWNDLMDEIPSFTKEDFDWFRASYRGEISYIDQELKRLIEWGDSSRIWDNTLLVIMSDHGESFEHNYYFNHTDRVYESLIHVPLLIHDPDNPDEQSRIQALVNLSDIFFTILNFLEIDPPNDTDEMNASAPGNVAGWDHNLRDVGEAEGWEFIASQSYTLDSGKSPGQFFSFRTPDWKLIYGPDAEPIFPEFQLYNIWIDPGELNNRYESINWAIFDEVDPAWLAGWASNQGISGISGLNPQMIQELRALGYIN